MVTRQDLERYNQRLDRSGWSLATILTGSVLLWQAPIGVTMLIMGLGFAAGVNLFLIPLLLIIGGCVALLKTLSRGRLID